MASFPDKPTTSYTQRTPHLFLPTDSGTACRSSIPGLHLQHGSEEVLGQRGQELDLGVGVQAVQHGALWGQRLVDVVVVAHVVHIGRHREARGQEQLAIQLPTVRTSA